MRTFRGRGWLQRHRVSRLTWLILALVFAMALMASAISCGPVREDTGEIGVVVTLVPVGDFVENVGGDKVDVTVMVPPGASPHTYEPTPPGQMVAVSEADMYVKVGSGVEFELEWMDEVIEANPRCAGRRQLCGCRIDGIGPSYLEFTGQRQDHGRGYLRWAY